jgi:hypothetical protein
VSKFVGKFRRERDYEDDRNKRNFYERKQKQKQTQNAKRMAYFESYDTEPTQEYEKQRK